MASVDNLDLVRWRAMDSIHVQHLLTDHIKQDPSFHPKSSHLTTRWHAHVAGKDWEVLCTGPKFWNSRMDRGGGGAVDLVMYLHGLTFKAATKFLTERGI